ncbi:MAG: thrombospondin type 3 repeat-containing protein [Bermanella sp.]
MGKLAFFLISFGMLGLISSYSQAKEIDSDADGISDRFERLLKTDPKNANSKPDDLDADGIPDGFDLDIDGDGVNNWQDPFPRNAQESADADKDGVGDSQDNDSDGDGFSNSDEKAAGTNAFNKNSFPDKVGPALHVVEMEEHSDERIVHIRGMAFDSGMGIKKVQVVNEDGDIFMGFFEYTTHFNVKVRLNRGDNELQVAAFDSANNVSRQFVNINYRAK